MKISNHVRFILGASIACLLVSAQLPTVSADQKTTKVEIRGLKLDVPSDWKKEQPKSRLRLAQFQIPAADGDKEGAELAVFSFGASGVQANVERWTKQFDPKGRKSKVTAGESEQGKYVFVELSGTYNKSVGPPIAGRKVAVPNSRVINVMLVNGGERVFFLKLAGLDKTVAAQTDALRKSFGGDASKEKELEFK